MSFSIKVTGRFKKQLKRLSKKHNSLKNDFQNFLDSLEKNPSQGKSIGNNCFKIRLAITSKGKGKSGGARIITHIQVMESKIYLLSIYDKSEQSTITEKEIQEILNSF